MNTITDIIRKRRSIFPPSYNDQPIAKEDLEEILENANWAPTHRKTEPWRFKVVQGKGLERLSVYMTDYYVKNTPAESLKPKKAEKMPQKALRSAAVIGIVMQRDPEARVPEWEEVAATAMAVQNMWLTCAAKGIGCYWSSPKSLTSDNSFFELSEGEICLGVMFMGYHDLPDLPSTRQAIEDKVEWIF